MGSFGLILIIITLFTGVSATAAYVLAFKDKSQSYLKIGNYLFLIMTGATAIASIVLLLALTFSDFSIEYVARYSDLSLPFLYKLSAFWAGQAGSLLLWLLLIAVFGTVEIYRLRDKTIEYRSAVFIAISISAAFFALLVAFLQNPFSMLDFIPRDGQGMNPMLQNPGMIIHPPTLYIGYVGFNIIVAHAFAALMTKDFSNQWIKLTRSWSLIIWVFLTIGIVIGGWWAYVELGWGGYWAWDPVENASLFPWFTSTAFIHSAYIYERKGRLKAWAFALIFVTFELTIFGTFITRSGVIESVHSFGKNPIGNFFLWFIIVTSIIYIWTMYKNRKVMEDTEEFHFLTREGLFFVANWVFVGVTFVTLFGTVLPYLSEIFTNQKTTVGISYFNKVSIPFFMMILILSGIAPLVQFGKQESKKVFMLILPSIIFSVAVMVISFLLGYTLLVPLLLIGFAAFSFATIVIIVGKRFKTTGISAFTKSNKFLGAMLVHLGVVLMALGITLSSFYNNKVDEIVSQDGVMAMDSYTFEIGKVHTEKGANYIAHYVPIKIYKDKKYISSAYPEMRVYNNHQEDNFAEVSYYSMFRGDLYFIFSGFDLEANQVRVQAIFQPLIGWIWVGCIIMAIGGIYCIMNFRPRKEEK